VPARARAADYRLLDRVRPAWVRARGDGSHDIGVARVVGQAVVGRRYGSSANDEVPPSGLEHGATAPCRLGGVEQAGTPLRGRMLGDIELAARRALPAVIAPAGHPFSTCRVAERGKHASTQAERQRERESERARGREQSKDSTNFIARSTWGSQTLKELNLHCNDFGAVVGGARACSGGGGRLAGVARRPGRHGRARGGGLLSDVTRETDTQLSCPQLLISPGCPSPPPRPRTRWRRDSRSAETPAALPSRWRRSPRATGAVAACRPRP
jgi:hypothetical protein